MERVHTSTNDAYGISRTRLGNSGGGAAALREPLGQVVVLGQVVYGPRDHHQAAALPAAGRGPGRGDNRAVAATVTAAVAVRAGGGR